MKLRLLFLALLATVWVSAQISVSYSEKQDKTILFYSVKEIDSVKLPGKWTEDTRDLAKAFYLKKDDKHISFRIDPMRKVYSVDCLKQFIADKKKAYKRWKFETLSTDDSTYQLYKISGERHPDSGQVTLMGCRSGYTFNIVAYGNADDASKSQFLIELFQQITP